MALRLYNTLTQQEEGLEPITDGHVRMYTCGPTVYNYVHIGNLRTFVFQDLLRRYLKLKGFRLTHVMNITDVDDKIIAGARAKGLTIDEYTPEYIEAFLEDIEALRIQKPEIMPRATEHIPDMIDMIETLKNRGLTYEKDGSIYFRISTFDGYGKLSHLDLSTVDTSGSFDADEYSKENPRDFVLWKASKPDEPVWDSPFGPGRPGWHIECSAMSMKYLGKSFDIHCGGVDLIFPHHENEIAQSEGSSGKPFVRYWIHAAHLIVEGEKMSKSKGNFFTLRDLLDRGYRPGAIRYLLASVQYRNQLNFTFAGLDQARSSLQRVNDFLQKIREIPEGQEPAVDLSDKIEEAERSFFEGLDSDLNTSEALAALFGLVREANPFLDRRTIGSALRDRILDLFTRANQVFDTFQLADPPLEDGEISALIEKRRELREQRLYAEADQIRDKLENLGILLEDTREGTRWKRSN